MIKDAISLEEIRLSGVEDVSTFHAVHERHRIFPNIFENRNHKVIIDISAGIGVVASRIKQFYQYDELICNDTSPTGLKLLEKQGFKTTSFDLDNEDEKYPFEDKTFDAVICLATIEHLIHTDHFLSEVRRILKDDGRLYLSAPNYSGLTYLLPFLISGKTFHDPLKKEDVYEFFGHVRYFTYRTMCEYLTVKGYQPESVYLGLPEGSSKYVLLKQRNKAKAFAVRMIFKTLYTLFSARWAAEPVICFKKSDIKEFVKPKKVVF